MRCAPVLGVLMVAMLVGCADDAPRRSCTTQVWATPSRPGAQLQVIGSWDGWLTPGIAMTASEDPQWLVARLDGEVPAGEYGYLILEDGAHRIDEHNPLTTFWAEEDDLEVSLLIVPDCEQPALVIEAAGVDEQGGLAVRARFEAASDGATLASASASTRTGELAAQVPVQVSSQSGEVSLRLPAAARGRHTLTVTAVDSEGRSASATASAFVDPVAAGWDDGLLYQVVTDRFRGDEGAALAPPATPGSRAGGTLDGITAEIERGTFAAMGVTGLWISPVYTNPVEAREGRGDGHMYEGYHGYWPSEPRGVDARIGGEAALDRLIATAHAAGIRVLLDVVPNHVYEDSPRFRERADDRWFNVAEPVCVCGLGSCDWGGHIQTCWFTDYLPDLRLQEPAALAAAYEDLLWWTRRFEVDGLRVDAVPMMPRAATRRMAHELRLGVQGESPFLIGEVFTGAGAWGVDVIRYYLGPDGLDSVFDFPLMWAIRDAVAHESAGFDAVEAMLTQVEGATAGSGAVLGQMIGNHDVTRFFSEAHGDAGGDPWAAPAEQAEDSRAFARVRTGLTLVLTLPGLPVLFYGDEIGLAGANDPDNRRVLPAWDSLGAEQRATRTLVQRLGTLRRCLPALRTGSRTAVRVEDRLYVYMRGEGEALVLLSSAAEARTVEVPDVLAPGEYVDVLSGERVMVGASGVQVELGPRQSRVLVRADSGCAG
jgi:glycosidase